MLIWFAGTTYLHFMLLGLAPLKLLFSSQLETCTCVLQTAFVQLAVFSGVARMMVMSMTRSSSLIGTPDPSKLTCSVCHCLRFSLLTFIHLHGLQLSGCESLPFLTLNSVFAFQLVQVQ